MEVFLTKNIVWLAALALCACAMLLAFPLKTEAAFPVVEATNTSITDPASATHNVSLPAGVNAGDLLIVFFTVDDADTVSISTPAGWSSTFDFEYSEVGGDDAQSAVFYKIADGSEGSAVTITTTSGTGRSAHQSYRISGASGRVEWGTSQTAEDASSPITPDPPAVTPSWGAKDTLWLAVCSIVPENVTSVTAPASYTDILSNQSSFSESCSARRELNASSENPGTFSGSGTGFWFANTLAIEPETVVAASRSVIVKPPNNLGLVGYWSFNEGTGTVATDFSGNGNHGTLQNSPPWISGKRGYALDFGGASDRIVVPATSALRPPNSITVATWVKISDTTTDNQHVIGYADGGGGYQLVLDSTFFGCSASSIGFWVSEGGDNCASYTFSNFSPSLWNHVVATFDGETILLYLNGVQVASDGGPSGSISYSGNTTFCIGQRSSGTAACAQSGTNFGGSLDEVRVYNRALSPSEVTKLYQSGAVKFTTSSVALQSGSTLANGLVGHWTFDGPDVTTVVSDRSGQGKHGGFLGGATSSAKVIGKLGQALSFDGSDDRVTFTSTDISTVHSAALWIDYQDSGDGVVLGGATGDYFFYVDQTDVYYSAAAGNFVQVAHGGLPAGQWTHLTVIRNGTSVTFYKNGAQIGSAQTLSSNDGLVVSTIGSYADASFPTQAKIDDVHIYNRVLTPTEIKQLYNLGKATIVP
ncbi:MAG TPA: LamG domain-containing protein [Candidatus Paceibacterota bacterium]|nr:LamG domain-containing protein [Candidatus Paceibacterota bacterium]